MATNTKEARKKQEKALAVDVDVNDSLLLPALVIVVPALLLNLPRLLDSQAKKSSFCL